MNILFISYYNPLGNGGLEKQTMGMFKTLVKQGCQIACLTVASPEKVEKIKSDLDDLGVFSLGSFVVSHQEKGYSKIAKILFWLSQKPTDFLASQHPELSKNIEQIINKISESKTIDVIHVLGLRSSYFIPEDANKPILIDLVDSMTLHKKRHLQSISFDLKNYHAIMLSLLDYWKTLKLEKDVLKKYLDIGFIASISSVDATFLNQIYPNNSISVVHSGYNINSLFVKENSAFPQIYCKTIVFYGFMEQKHNIDALMFLVKDILPLVLEKHSNLKLLITGFNLSEQIFELSKNRDWLEVITEVEDIIKFISQAQLMCFPFRVGAGIKTKILESMALAKPVVTTNIGAEALTETQKQGLLIADDAEGLAQHIINLFNDPHECLRLGQINYQIAITEFTWEKKAEDYLTLYNSCIKKFENYTYKSQFKNH